MSCGVLCTGDPTSCLLVFWWVFLGEYFDADAKCASLNPVVVRLFLLYIVRPSRGLRALYFCGKRLRRPKAHTACVARIAGFWQPDQVSCRGMAKKLRFGFWRPRR